MPIEVWRPDEGGGKSLRQLLEDGQGDQVVDIVARGCGFETLPELEKRYGKKKAEKIIVSSMGLMQEAVDQQFEDPVGVVSLALGLGIRNPEHIRALELVVQAGEGTRTTQLYNRSGDEVEQGEVELIRI